MDNGLSKHIGLFCNGSRIEFSVTLIFWPENPASSQDSRGAEAEVTDPQWVGGLVPHYHMVEEFNI
jgi:hypothetical protein